MKNITIILLSFPIVISIGVLAKYNIQLDNFIGQESNKHLNESSNLITPKTEVHIVGTVHFETDSIKRHHFYNYLDRISPSVILFEGDSNAVKKIAKRTDYFSQLIDAFKSVKRVEKPIVLKYLEHHPHCLLLPYEWELRVKYH